MFYALDFASYMTLIPVVDITEIMWTGDAKFAEGKSSENI